MKQEEIKKRAEEYNRKQEEDNAWEDYDEQAVSDRKHFTEKAWKDGAKWGMEHEWHDLRKNPNNLPKDCNTFVLNQDGEKCRKYSNLWIDIYGHCVTVIAWCELPQFKDKE